MDELKKIVKELAEKTNELRESQKKTDEQIEKTSQELRKLGLTRDEEIDKTRKMVADLTNGWGRFTEGLIIPSLEKIVSSLGMNLQETAERRKKRRKGEEMEIDILGVARKDGKEVMIAVEAKTYLRRDDVNDFISAMEKFPYFFEEYRDREMICFVAFMNCEKGVTRYAESQGLYVMGPSDDIMVIMNKKGFKPRIFKA